MPAPRLKREISEPQKDITRHEDPLIPALLTSVAQEVCAAMHASGAIIAGPDPQGIRCMASAGNAPAVGSRLETDPGLTVECLKTGKVVFRGNSKRKARGRVTTEERSAVHSAVAVPIVAEGFIVGAIEVFSSRTSAIYKTDIAPLIGIAEFIAPILAPSAVYESKRATGTATVIRDQAQTSSASDEKQIALTKTADPGNSGSVRLIVEGFASKTASARAGLAGIAATMVRHLGQDTAAKRLLASAAVLVAAALLFVGFHTWFVKSSNTAAQRQSNEPRFAVPPKVEEGNPRQSTGTQAPEALSHSSSSAAPLGTRSQPSADSETPATPANVASTNPAVRATTEELAIESTASRPAAIARESNPIAQVENQPSGTAISSTPATAERNIETPELPMDSAQVPVLAVTPAVAVAIEAAMTSRPAFVLDRTFKGHSSWVTSVVFSPDGRRLASGSWDQTIKFWDVPTGHEVDTLGGKMKEVQALALSRDGRWLAAENSSDTVMLWDATTGTEVRTLLSNKPLGPLGTNFVYSIAFSPDGRWLASGVDEKTVRLWDVHTGQAVRDLTTTRRAVIYAAFSPDGRWFASGDDDKSIRIWDASTGAQFRRLTGHRKPIYAVAFSPNGRWLASASADKTIKLWDVAEGREVHTLSGHGGSVTSLAFSPDGRWLASGSWDKTVKIWSVETGQEVQTLGGGHDHSIYTVAFDSRGRWLASGSEDGSISLWRSGGALDRARLQ
jgi:WD40 repeat protein